MSSDIPESVLLKEVKMKTKKTVTYNDIIYFEIKDKEIISIIFAIERGRRCERKGG